MASLSDQCCTLPPFKSDYEPLGQTIKLDGGLQMYTTGPKDARIALVGIYDIYGFHNNTFQGADVLAKETGYRIVLPDFFRGQGWDVNNVPPREGRPALDAHIQKVGAIEIVLADLVHVTEHLNRDGATSIGGYGFCWGAKKLTQAEDAGLHLFNALAFVHPSFKQKGDAIHLSVPCALVPSQGEDQEIMNDFWSTVQSKPFANKCVRKDFLDVPHGFCAARANWADPLMAKRANQAYQILASFFKANL